MPNVGKRRHKVTLRAPVHGSNDDLGRETTYPSETAWRWAAIKPTSAKEMIEGEAPATEITHTIEMRYYEGLTTDYRITLGSRTFELVAVIDVDERHVTHMCTAKEVEA